MDYGENEKLIGDHNLNHFGELGTNGPIYDIHDKIISTHSMIAEVKKEMKKNGGNNKMALIDLGLFNNDNLRVFMESQLPDGKYVREDMYNYLLDTSQLKQIKAHS